jgi:hypothetical protein
MRLSPPRNVIPRACGVSSTPRPIVSITASLEYWIVHPSAQLRTGRTMTAECASAISRRVAPEACLQVCPRKSEGAGNAGCRLAPAVSCARCTQECAHEHTGTAEAARHSLRNGFTAYAELSLETNSSCLHRQRIDGSHHPVGRLQTSASLTPATGARTTRFCRTQLPPPNHSASQCRRPNFWRKRLSAVRLRAVLAHGRPPCEHLSRLTLPRPPQPAPTFVTMANAPLLGTGWRAL